MWCTMGSRLLATIKAVGALALGGVILGNVARHSGTQKGVAYVHISEANVDVTIDDDAYHVDSLAETPIVCELAPGGHTLQMARGGRIVFEQAFRLDAGKEIVLSAWEEPAEPPAIISGAQPFFNASLALPTPHFQRTSQEAESTRPGSNHPRSSGGPRGPRG